MGVVNITPDSFSDGGSFLDPRHAHRHAADLVGQGADIVDLGAESTRPGARFITAEEEWRRLEPVLELIAREPLGALVSVDTNKPEIMRKAVEMGATIVNDVQGGADDATLRWLAAKKVCYIAMHMYQTPATMQDEPRAPSAALVDVAKFYDVTRQRLLAAGFVDDRVWLDPGIGFGKTDAANLRLLEQACRSAERYNLVVGVSRKGFIGRMTGIDVPSERDAASKMLELSLMLAGVRCIRTHDVARLAKIRDVLRQA